jgi:peptide/nickel transport system permease protein
VRRLLVARLSQSLIVVFIVTTISFFVIRSAPGDPFSYDSPNVTPAVREHWRQQLGYARPLPVQFARYLVSAAHGDLGYSVRTRQPVSTALAQAIPRTLLLTSLSLALSFVLGLILGVFQAARRGGWFDRVSSGVLLFFYSLPDFWGALMVLLLFSYVWPIFPSGHIVDPVVHEYMSGWDAFLDRLRHLVLPVASLTLLTMAGISRYQRAAMLEVLPSDFIRTARAKGLSEREIIWRHALRTALTPMVALLGLLLPGLLGGALFVEKVFSWPGMGLLAADAISARDYDLVTATVIVGSIMVIVGNVLADLLHVAIDPRIRE